MKVMCISENFYHEVFNIKPNIHPKFGEIVTVIGKSQNGKGYRLQEYLDGGFPGKCYWRIENFAPLSEIDETELVKERELVNA